MICSNCGSQVPEVLASCQNCGTPVSGAEANGSGGKNAPKQPELPAWLETLRSSERPPSPASSASSYATDFVDKDGLPSWMRPDIPDNMQSGKFPAVRPASRPAPNTEGNGGSLTSMSARSLVDEQSLPSWMQEPQAGQSGQSSQFGQAGQTPPAVGQQSIAASSLIQQEAVPDWMKAVLPSSQPASAPSQIPQMPPTYQPQPMTPSLAGPQQSTPYTPRVAGSDLIDPQSLPPWMSAQAQGAPTAQYGGNSGQGQSGMSAGSLIDQSALPSWLREGSQQAQPNGASAMPTGFPLSSPPQGQPVPPAQSVWQPPTAQGNSISASSFIDVDALPDWLRPAGEQPRPGVPGVPGVPNVAGGPGRVENVRVPSRPRGDMPSIEESAVAANVFASMLGVASAAPNFPGQQPGAQAGFGPQSGMMPPSTPTQQPQASQGSNWKQSGVPEGLQGLQPSNLPPLAPPPGYNIPTPQSLGVAQSPQSPAPGRSPQPSAGSSQFGPADGQQKNGAKKRGFLETILNWFSR